MEREQRDAERAKQAPSDAEKDWRGVCAERPEMPSGPWRESRARAWHDHDDRGDFHARCGDDWRAREWGPRDVVRKEPSSPPPAGRADAAQGDDAAQGEGAAHGGAAAATHDASDASDDSRIRAAVREVFARHGEHRVRDVVVTVVRCEVTLRGSVSRREEKLALERAIETIEGVRDVMNLLRLTDRERHAEPY